MVAQDRVKKQLQAIGSDFSFVGRAELMELPKILFDDEVLQHVVFGRYSSGFAILCASNQRVLLVDKKPMYLTLEDVRYDMISDIMFNRGVIDSSVTLGTVHKSITFTAFNKDKLRELSNYVQERVMHSRSYQYNIGLIGSAQESSSPIDSALVNAQKSARDVAVSGHPAKRSPYRNPIIIRKRASKFFPEFFSEV
jgi:hypothetical protein